MEKKVLRLDKLEKHISSVILIVLVFALFQERFLLQAVNNTFQVAFLLKYSFLNVFTIKSLCFFLIFEITLKHSLR